MLEPLGDHLRELLGAVAARRHAADQRQVDVAAGIDGVAVGDAVLAEHHDAQLVAAIERVGLLIGGGRRGVAVRRRDIRSALRSGILRLRPVRLRHVSLRRALPRAEQAALGVEQAALATAGGARLRHRLLIRRLRVTLLRVLRLLDDLRLGVTLLRVLRLRVGRLGILLLRHHRHRLAAVGIDDVVSRLLARAGADRQRGHYG